MLCFSTNCRDLTEKFREREAVNVQIYGAGDPTSGLIWMAGEAGIEPALTRFWRPPLFR
jgi:hypothetical protein